MGRIVDVVERGTKLQTDSGRLLVIRSDGTTCALAFADVDVVVISECAVSLTGRVLADLARNGVPVVLGGPDYRPVGMMTPTAAHHAQTGVLRRQIGVHPSTLSRLWQKIVRAKIAQQATLLRERGLPDLELRQSLAVVLRGDATNAEGLAARAYWRTLGIFPRRDRSAPDANRLLNYCYTVVYAAAARALCATGLHPGLGLHHRNASNDYCLASDLMEPFRIAADRAVVDWLDRHPGETELTPACKADLLRNLLGMGWRVGPGETSLFEALAHAAVSLRRCILENAVDLDVPELLCA